MKIIFLGAPGAGKGTQAEIVAGRLGIPTVSTGAMIRSALRSGTELGKKAQAFMEAGALVPDDVVIGIIKERLAEKDCQNGFILDGFPRTVAQAEALDAMGVAIDRAVSIEVPDRAIMERMTGRRVCPSCSASYHVTFHPTADGIHCDKCGAELTMRADDKPDVVLSRLELYHSTTEPIKAFYEGKGTLICVDGVGTVEEISARTLSALGVC